MPSPAKKPSRTIRAPRGSDLTCKTWITEAAMRMLMNNLDPEVAENPAQLVVYGGRGKAARNWACFDAIVAALRSLADDETLLVQSGKPVGVVRTHPDAQRVLIANSNLVPHWATQTKFDELEKKGLMMFGQMTAGSWIYIGTQGILQGTYETFAEVGRQHFGGTLAGKFCVTAGCGGMGGAQPLAITMAGGACLIADMDLSRLKKRRHDRYLHEIAPSLDEAIARARRYATERKARSVGVLANAVIPRTAVAVHRQLGRLHVIFRQHQIDRLVLGDIDRLADHAGVGVRRFAFRQQPNDELPGFAARRQFDHDVVAGLDRVETGAGFTRSLSDDGDFAEPGVADSTPRKFGSESGNASQENSLARAGPSRQSARPNAKDSGTQPNAGVNPAAIAEKNHRAEVNFFWRCVAIAVGIVIVYLGIRIVEVWCRKWSVRFGRTVILAVEDARPSRIWRRPFR